MIEFDIELKQLEKEAEIREYYKKTPSVDCGDGVYKKSYEGATLEDFETFAAGLKAEADGDYYEREVVGNRFVGVNRKNGYVYISYFPWSERLSLYFSNYGKLIPEKLTEGVTISDDPTLIQFMPTDPLDGPSNTGNFGMCYIFDLGEGHFLVYDGLGDRHEDDVRIYDSLRNATPAGKKPEIEAWIFTHPHWDHVVGARKLALKHKDDIEVRNFIMNMPDSSRYVLRQAKECADCFAMWLPDIFACFPNAKIWKVHTGQRFFVGNAEIEVLYTHEDHPDEKLVKLNDSSLVTRVYYGGKSFLFPADIETQKASRLLHDTYGKYLKSDFYQTAHHGWEACALEYYYDVDPKYVLFPLRPKHWYNDTFWSFPATAVYKEELESGKRKYYATTTEDHVIRLSELD